MNEQRAMTSWQRLFGWPISAQAVDVGLLLVRVTLGLAFVFHGWPNIQHPFSWADGFFAAPPIFAAIAEFVGGIAIIAGLATRLFAFMLVCDMFTAIAFVKIPHGARFVATHGGSSYELETMYWISAILLVLAGPGRYAIDRLGWAADRK